VISGYLAVCFSAVLLAAAAAWQWRSAARRRWRLAGSDPDALLEEPISDDRSWSRAMVVVGLGLIGVIFVSAAAPIGSMAGRVHLVSPVGALSALGLGWAGFSRLARWYDWALADVSMGLFGAAAVAIGLWFVPRGGAPLDEHLPKVLTVCMVAMSVTSGFWVWLGGVWQQQIGPEGCWTVAGRLVPVTRRMGFVTACLAVLLGMLVACWPVLWMVGTPDDSPGRVASATGAHLLLLLVLIRNYRAMRRRAMVILGVWTVLSLVVLIGVRSGPWASVVVPASGGA